MKFLVLGCGDEKAWEAMSKSAQEAMMEECFAYDDVLLARGNWLGDGTSLHNSRTAKTLRWKDGKVMVTDGPFAETKEQLGGAGLLEARDMKHAVELISKHPGIRWNALFEIRPIDEAELQRCQQLDAQHGDAARNAPKAGSVQVASLGYIGERAWMHSPKEFETMMNECHAFHEACHKEGQWRSGIALQGPDTAKTVRSRAGEVIVTDGPYMETKEWLGGMVVLALKSMRQAIEIYSKHPCLRYGVAIELRLIDLEFTKLWEERKRVSVEDAQTIMA